MKAHKIEKENQKAHLKTHVADVKPILCPVCGQIFSKRSLMKEHMSNIHVMHQENQVLQGTGMSASTSTGRTDYCDTNGDNLNLFQLSPPFYTPSSGYTLSLPYCTIYKLFPNYQ
ncbi:unnamed protein product [Acanthosepion pharaonis]|uniref:C2H2-type domain-containing protein n=1 Tax=Acanthosepion pharaonis TaxID=158019 RepID=A0A812F0H6_ACAPH|nr:unnamed protein product [Sepia pharaonis]